MTPMERAARAIYKLGDNGPYALEEEDEQWHHHLDTARAVLEAIREPSEGMIHRGARNEPSRSRVVSQVWGDMIDAALDERPEG